VLLLPSLNRRRRLLEASSTLVTATSGVWVSGRPTSGLLAGADSSAMPFGFAEGGHRGARAALRLDGGRGLEATARRRLGAVVRQVGGWPSGAAS
jgi:hypothetical protein